MAVIEKEIRLVGSKGETRKVALFDSGATYSCIRPDVAKELETILPLPEPMEFGAAENERKVVAKECVRLNFYLEGFRFSDEFMLIEDLPVCRSTGRSEPVIIGAKTMQAWRMKLDFEEDRVIIDERVTRLRPLKGI